MPKRKTRRAKRTNKPNYVVYKDELLKAHFGKQKTAVLFALQLHDEEPTALVQVSGYGETGKYFFQQFQTRAE